jgi:hypothetical protein
MLAPPPLAAAPAAATRTATRERALPAAETLPDHTETDGGNLHTLMHQGATRGMPHLQLHSQSPQLSLQPSPSPHHSQPSARCWPLPALPAPRSHHHPSSPRCWPLPALPAPRSHHHPSSPRCWPLPALPAPRSHHHPSSPRCHHRPPLRSSLSALATLTLAALSAGTPTAQRSQPASLPL